MIQVFIMRESLQRAQRGNFQYFATIFGLLVFCLSGALKTHSRTACSLGYLEKSHQNFKKRFKKIQVLRILLTFFPSYNLKKKHWIEGLIVFRLRRTLI